ncbi:hypothetical protein [Shewanella gelidii]|nr:hypothetical protein [Shewanella gelidii]MCL1098188.1 hypothetical protein [Shewanella gelidii]
MEIFGIHPSTELQLMSDYTFMNEFFGKKGILSCDDNNMKVLLSSARKKFLLQFIFGGLLVLLVFINAAIQS